jgi:hypothetical protein
MLADVTVKQWVLLNASWPQYSFFTQEYLPS